MPRHRRANLYVFFKTKVSKRRGKAILADHNLAPVSWLPQLNGHGLALPPRLARAAYRLLEECHEAVAVMQSKGGSLRAVSY